jgi:uncharacterized Tic20 family protein
MHPGVPGDAQGPPRWREGRGGVDHEGMDPSYGTAALRVSDAEREPVIERLKLAFADGRLPRPEFDLRLQLAMTATTRGELDSVQADLVSRQGAPPSAARPQRLTAGDLCLASVAHASCVVPVLPIPLLVVLKWRASSPYVRRHASEALNFQLTLLLLVLVTFGIGSIVYTVSWVLALIGAVVALIGQEFRYPWILHPFS